jgi:dTDP-4-dehydrorhamnose 3,5-epimerase
MKKLQSSLAGVWLLEPRVFEDDRGFFLESYNAHIFAELGIRDKFVQDNHSYSDRNVLRGLGYQLPQSQGKLVRVISGDILDVIVDLRVSSATFGKWESFRLSGNNKHILWVPVGFAHGFRVLSGAAHVLYKATAFYAPEHERIVAWNDSELNIEWKIDREPILSGKDQHGLRFSECPKFP